MMRWLYWILSANLLYMVGEILVRRWWMRQVPTQLPAEFIYVLLIADVTICALLLTYPSKRKA